MNPRLLKVQELLTKNHYSGLIVSKRENIQYLTSLHQLHPTSREALLFISQSNALLYHSPFLTPPPQSNLDFCLMSPQNSLSSVLSNFFTNTQPSNRLKSPILIESHDLKVAEFDRISQALSPQTLLKTTDLIEIFRQIKDEDEINLIKKASQITAKTMAWATDLILRHSDSPTISETSLSHLIEEHMYSLGATSLAFPSVVAFGAHTASPHHEVSNTKLTQETPVLLDIGAAVNGYCSDMTRTFWFGQKPEPEFLKIKKTVDSAYLAAKNTLGKNFKLQILTQTIFTPGVKVPGDAWLNTPGVEVMPAAEIGDAEDSPGVKSLTAAEIDNAARQLIKNAGYGANFIHTTGHALGLEIHEQPSLNASNPTPLTCGLVITIEPGIYLKDKFGYRHEDTLLLKM